MNLSSVQMEFSSPEWGQAAEDLKINGIATVPILFSKEADYLKKAYVDGVTEPLLSEAGVAAVDNERAAKAGNTKWTYVSFTDPVLMRLLLNDDVIKLVESYYGAQPYFRRMPFIKQTIFQAHHQPDISTVYHIDQGKHFVGVMFLLSDLTERDSHMKFLLGTHKFVENDFRFSPDDPRNQELDKQLERDYAVFPLVGQKGTMFVYDNGNGIHKGQMVLGTTRNVMQATFSRGDHEVKPKDRELLPDNLRDIIANESSIVRNSVEKIL